MYIMEFRSAVVVLLILKDLIHFVHIPPLYKGDKFCDFLFSSLHVKPLLKRNLF